jgi:hypothetical protein
MWQLRKSCNGNTYPMLALPGMEALALSHGEKEMEKIDMA